jgi:hypothetical protein
MMQCVIAAMLALATAAGAPAKAEQPTSADSAAVNGAETQAQESAKPQAALVHLMSAEKEKRLRQLLPKLGDDDLQAMLNDPRLIMYTEQEMPRAFQDWSGDLQGVHSAYYNISANGSEPFGNGNREFPWGSPAGTQRVKNVEAFRFVWLPRDENGKPLPVVWYRKRLRGDSNEGYAWIFPVGAVVGEVLSMTGPDGLQYTFELRIRTREQGYWDVDVFRPFPTAAELSKKIKQLRPDWEFDDNLSKFIAHLDDPLEMKVKTLADKQPARRTFEQKMGIDSLPELSDAKLVGELLTGTTFRSTNGEVWRQSPGGAKTYAPTTEAKFSIIPASYDAGFVQVDRTSCMRCHDSVARPVSDFNPGRDWYGHIRGSDGIFSFHPFAPESVSDNGIGRSVKMRSAFEQAGVIAKYDEKVHPAKIYHTLEAVAKTN